MNTNDAKNIASQLSRPQGEEGIKVAENMHVNNSAMIRHTIDLLPLREGDTILEIGPGNGGYASYVLSKAAGMQYYGVDISETMVQEALQQNAGLVASGQVIFTLGNGLELPYADHFFDGIFTVNTLYFWKDPVKQLQEIRRVLKPGGSLGIGIRSRRCMEDMPFTQYGFHLYDADEARALLERSGFRVAELAEVKEGTLSIMGMEITMERIVMIAA